MHSISKGRLYGICVAIGLMAAVAYTAVSTATETYHMNSSNTNEDGVSVVQRGNINGFTVSDANGSHNSGYIDIWSPSGDVTAPNYKALLFRAYVGASPTTTNGLGNVDTGVLVLKTLFGGSWFTVDSSFGAVPCSLRFSKVSPLVDSLWKGDLRLYYDLGDSSGAAAASVDFPFQVDMNAKRLY